MFVISVFPDTIIPIPPLPFQVPNTRMQLNYYGRTSSTTNDMGTWNHTFVGNSGLVDKITTGAPGAVQEVDYDYYPATSGRFLWKIFNRKTVGGTLISRHQYTYGTLTEFGQIKTWDRELPLSAGGYSINTQTFGHDAIGQLKTAAETEEYKIAWIMLKITLHYFLSRASLSGAILKFQP